MGVIYLRRNLLNGKQYVGQTQNMQQRENNEEVCRFKSVEEAIRHGYSRHISEVANGKRIKSNNLYWKWIK